MLLESSFVPPEKYIKGKKKKKRLGRIGQIKIYESDLRNLENHMW